MQMPPIKYQTTLMRGGWDQVSPTLSLAPGVARDGLNYEVAQSGGYARIGGYERYDGQAKPSDAGYSIVQVSSFTNVPVVGQTLTQAATGATGVIVAVVVVDASWMVVTKVTGTFNTSTAVAVGATAIGTATPITVTPTALQDAQYTNGAADVYRALINPVPGSGPVRGIVGATFSGTDYIYAFRDNAGGTAVDLYKDSGSGWTQVTLPSEVSFTAGGTATPADGATLTQGGVTATVKRVLTQSGEWTGSAAGRFVITSVAGGNFASGAATLTGGAACTLSGIQTAVTIATGGTFDFDQGNFAGQAGSIRIYGCDGINRMFEFDGTTFVPLATGATSDVPTHIAIHQNALLASIASSIFYSGPGTPYRFLPIDGGGEIATGDTITNFLVMPGDQSTGACAVYTISTTQMLYGKSAASWNLVKFNVGTGGYARTAKNMGQSYVFDNRGVTTLQAAQNFGNFTSSTLTANIRTFINEKRSSISCATLAREKSQYRLFFTTGDGLFLTIVNGKYLGAFPIRFPDAVNCVWEGEQSTGKVVSFFGAATGGYVYQLDVGSSFDGSNVDSYVTLVWDAIGSPRLIKRFRHASLEVQGNSYAELQLGHQMAYGTDEKDQTNFATYTAGLQGTPKWDTFTWDQFNWDGRTIVPTTVDLTGSGENIQYTISSSRDYILPYTLNSIITHYTPRRGLR